MTKVYCFDGVSPIFLSVPSVVFIGSLLVALKRTGLLVIRG